MAVETSRGAEDIMCELIEKSFSARTVGEQKEILQHKKPQPKLGARTANRQFQENWYAMALWLNYFTKIVFLAVPFICSRKIANVDQTMICRYALFSFRLQKAWAIGLPFGGL